MTKVFKTLLIGLIISTIFILPVNAKEKEEVVLHLFYGDGCPHCEVEKEFLDELEKEYDNLKVIEYETWYNEENAELMDKVAKELNAPATGVPFTVIGSDFNIGYQDHDTTGLKIERMVEYYSNNEHKDIATLIIENNFSKEDLDDGFEKYEEETDEASTISVPFIGSVNTKSLPLASAAVLIGIVDGFNPCAMWILLFLISMLLGMKNKKRMWIIGLTFLITSALVYMLIMMSWLSLAVKISTVVWIRNSIAIVSLIAAFINIKKFIKTNDSGCEVVDDKKRKSIITKIKKFTTEKSLLLALLGVITLAVSVNIIELACSLGLPLIFTQLLALNEVVGIEAFGYTLLYILFFLIDDIIVFAIAMKTSELAGKTTKYNKYSHLIGGIIMLLIGLLLLIKPEILMFNI